MLKLTEDLHNKFSGGRTTVVAELEAVLPTVNVLHHFDDDGRLCLVDGGQHLGEGNTGETQHQRGTQGRLSSRGEHWRASLNVHQ